MTHAIINTTDLNKVNFTEVLQTQANLKYSSLGSQFYISWNDEEVPTSIQSLDFEGPYNDDELNIIMSSHIWKVIV